MTSHHIDDGGWHKKWGNSPGAPGGVLDMGVLDQRKPADSRTDNAGDAGGQLIVERLACGQARILHSLRCRSDPKMNEGVHRTRIFCADVRLQVKSLDLTRNPAGEVRRIELGDEVNAGFSGEDVGPGIGHRVTHGADATQAGHDNATTAHA